MATPRPLKTPPIVEAVVDIRFPTVANITEERLSALASELADRYPTRENRKQMRAEFRFENGEVMAPETRDLGFHNLLLKSSDGNRVAQFGRDGFSLNNLGAYVGAQEFTDFLTAPPDIPKPAAQLINSFLSRIVGVDPTPILLDIDVFRFGEFSVEGSEIGPSAMPHWSGTSPPAGK